MMNTRKKSPIKLFLGSLLLLFGGDYLYNELLGVNDFLNVYYVFGLLFFFLVTLFFLGKRTLFSKFNKTFSPIVFKLEKAKTIFKFIVMMLLFEFGQMIMDSNNIFLVNKYFSFSNAHMYGNIAFIGKFLHIIVWTFIILLLPSVLGKIKKGKSLRNILLQYVRYILGLSLIFVSCAYFFPIELSQIIYGEGNAMSVGIMGKYILIISLFIIAKMFTYYFLYLKLYMPAFLTVILGISQTFLIVLFHSSIAMVLNMQLIVMITLVIAQLLYFAQNKK